MKKYSITESKLKKIIIEAINDELNSRTYGNLNNFNKGSNYQIISIHDRDEFNRWSNVVWDMLVPSYENNGGLKTYRNFTDFCKKMHIIELVLDENGQLLSCATYRRIEDGLKMVACGCDQSKEGKRSLTIYN